MEIKLAHTVILTYVSLLGILTSYQIKYEHALNVCLSCKTTSVQVKYQSLRESHILNGSGGSVPKTKMTLLTLFKSGITKDPKSVALQEMEDPVVLELEPY